MKFLACLLLLISSIGASAQSYVFIGSDPSGDCTTTCSDIREIRYDFDIALDSAWFRIITYEDRSNSDGYYIHINWEDSDTDGDDWTGGSYYLDFNQNRQLNIMYGSAYYWIEEFDAGVGTFISSDVTVSFPNVLTTVINCKLSDIDPDLDGTFNMAASVGNSSYGIFDILPDAGELPSSGPASIESQAQKEITIYPNPASANVSISFGDHTVSEVNILNTVGKSVFEKKIGSEKDLFIKTSTLPAGVYFVQLKADNGLVTKRLVIR